MFLGCVCENVWVCVHRPADKRLDWIRAGYGCGVLGAREVGNQRCRTSPILRAMGLAAFTSVPRVSSLPELALLVHWQDKVLMC